MVIGFNAWTDEARDKLEELGVRFRRTGPTSISVYTEEIDLRHEELRDRWIEDPNFYQSEEFRSQRLRIYKADNGAYYYLIRDHVFYKYDKESKDYSTSPPTIFVTSILDVVDEDMQEHWRSFFHELPPMAESGRFI